MASYLYLQIKGLFCIRLQMVRKTHKKEILMKIHMFYKMGAVALLMLLTGSNVFAIRELTKGFKEETAEEKKAREQELIDAVDPGQELFNAIDANNEALVKELIANNVNVNIHKPVTGLTPLMLAAKKRLCKYYSNIA
jgi:hypothetical protein